MTKSPQMTAMLPKKIQQVFPGIYTNFSKYLQILYFQIFARCYQHMYNIGFPNMYLMFPNIDKIISKYLLNNSQVITKQIPSMYQICSKYAFEHVLTFSNIV